MADAPILVCACGMRLKAAGAIPGRVGKCPRCGGFLRVPEPEPAPPAIAAGSPDDRPGGYGLAAGPQTKRPNLYTTSTARRSRAEEAPLPSTHWSGLIRTPERPETRLRDSLAYPVWGPTGVALLVFLPPAFWILTLPALTVMLSPTSGGLFPLTIAMLSLLPTSVGLFAVGGYTLLFLGRVLVSSALGEVHHPRWPDWDLGEMLRGMGRWIWALLIGGVVGGFPATAYWIYCGDIDPLDAIVLAELIAVGAVYAQIALLASILYDDPLGANPITVLRAIARVKWACVRPALVTGFAALLATAALAAVLEITNPALSALTYWAFWAFLLYAAMVVLRVLGLFYHRHAQVLGWFRDRPRWGA